MTLKANQHLLDLAQNTYQSQDRYGQLLRKSFNLGSSARIDVNGTLLCSVCNTATFSSTNLIINAFALSRLSITSLCSQAGVEGRFFHMHTVSVLVVHRRISCSILT